MQNPQKGAVAAAQTASQTSRNAQRVSPGMFFLSFGACLGKCLLHILFYFSLCVSRMFRALYAVQGLMQ
jgi:hypothetical protein